MNWTMNCSCSRTARQRRSMSISTMTQGGATAYAGADLVLGSVTVRGEPAPTDEPGRLVPWEAVVLRRPAIQDER